MSFEKQDAEIMAVLSARGHLAIYGAGGCGRDILAAILRSRPSDKVAFVDDLLAGQTVMGVPVMAHHQIDSEWAVIIAIADSAARQKIERQCRTIAGFVANTALISVDAVLGPGAVVSDHVLVGPGTVIGRQFQANYYSYVSHDCVIGDYVTFAPRVSCNGNVTIGDHAYVGAGAIIRQGIEIGARAVVGMGAVVVRDVPAGAKVVGNPARPILE